MKITKASTNVKCDTSGKTECNSRYSKAEKYIKSSIEELSKLEDDDIAKDCIANLAVVLFDMKSDNPTQEG